MFLQWIVVFLNFFFFFSLCKMERSCIFIKQKLWKLPSKTDIANLEKIQVWLIATLKYAILKWSCGVWSLRQANLLSFLHSESLSREESVDMKQESNLRKLFATFLLCIWTSIKLLKINLYFFSLLCCWANSCDDIQNSYFLLLPVSQALLAGILLICWSWTREAAPVSMNFQREA